MTLELELELKMEEPCGGIGKRQRIRSSFFSQHPLFQCIAADKETFAELLKKVRLAHYSKSEYLYKHGEKSKYVYLVQDGEIHITHRVENSQQTSLIGVQRHGAFFGEVSLISGQSHTADAQPHLTAEFFLFRALFL